jgi:hypothetical protein
MCLIIACPTKQRPTLATLKAAHDQNRDGIGLAWVSKKHNEVRFEKGLTVKLLHEQINNITSPLVVHFRSATVGSKNAELCHPFVVSNESPVDTRGSAKRVLFHNGHWEAWQEFVLKTAITKNLPIPEGEWTDSRAAAWLASVMGTTVLQFITGKFAVLSTKGVRLFNNGWIQDGELFYSNMNWKESLHRRNYNRQLTYPDWFNKVDDGSTHFDPRDALTVHSED